MSADNYMLIRFDDGQYVVSMEFASAEYLSPVGEGVRFDSWYRAREHAEGEWTEYGVQDTTRGPTHCPACGHCLDGEP